MKFPIIIYNQYFVHNLNPPLEICKNLLIIIGYKFNYSSADNRCILYKYFQFTIFLYNGFFDKFLRFYVIMFLITRQNAKHILQ